MGETCRFPQDHPIQNPVASDVVEMHQNRVYTFNNTFGNCSGCVTSLTFCYRPRNVSQLMTIEIKKPGNSGNIDITHVVTVNSTNDRNNCARRYGLTHPDCCVNQTLTEPFRVQRQSHYALNISTTDSLLLRLTQMEGSMYRPLFYFTIDTSSGRLCAQPLPLDAELLCQVLAIAMVVLRQQEETPLGPLHLPLPQLLLGPLHLPLSQVLLQLLPPGQPLPQLIQKWQLGLREEEKRVAPVAWAQWLEG